MIVVRLLGGLGNQLFQYAAGRRLARARKCELKLDVTAFDEYRLRTYRLGNFSIAEKFATPEEIGSLRARGIRRAMLRVSPRLGPRAHALERSFRFDPSVLERSAPAYLDGYWQSPKYFQDVDPIIRADLKARLPAEGENARLLQEIGSVSSVAVHVRRGDYAADPRTRMVHGVLPPGYYEDAIAYLKGKVKEPRYFVFSDDTTWARKNLRLDGPATFVAHNGPDADHEDLRLMAACRHHVIANSTFSWWGAWLGKRPGQIVVGPRRWFNADDDRARDLWPDGWHLE
jgi:hypothetical protein